MLITLLALLAASLAMNAFQRGIIQGMHHESINNSRVWNDGYAKAREFFENDAHGYRVT